MELVESPIIDRFIPLDEEAAAAQSCGRFCVVLDADSGEGLDGGLLPIAAASHTADAVGSTVVAVTLAGMGIAAIARAR